MTTSDNSIRLHRVFKCPPDRLYRAFVEPAALCKWLPPYGYVATMHESDIRTGGYYRMSFTNFGTGQSHSFQANFIELTPNSQIRYTDKFDDPSMPGEMPVIITLRKVSCGTELTALQENLPSQIPPEQCYLGWQESLEQLKRLVEPQIQ